MKKSDIGLAGIIYGIILFFFVMTIKLKAEAQIYPMVVMIILFSLNTLYLVKSVWQMKKEKGHIIDDMGNLFEGFQARQFTIVVVLSVIYLVLISTLGFYCATLVYLIGALFMLKVPKLHILITVVCFELLVYGAFTLFLHVPLPTGLLF